MTNRFIGKTIISTALVLAGMVLTSTPAQAETHFSIGIGVSPGYGYYAPPPVAYRPVYPGSGYYWTDGYYDAYGYWVEGFWAPRAYGAPRFAERGYYVAPRFIERGYYDGYRRDFDRDEHRRFDRDDFRGRGNAFGRRR